MSIKERLTGVPDTPVPLIEEPSDLENPAWGQFAVDEDGAMTFGHGPDQGHEGVRTVSGFIDLMHHVTDDVRREIEEVITGKVPAAELPDWLREVLPVNQPALIDVRAYAVPAAKFHTDTFIIPGATVGGQIGGATLVSSRVDRWRIILTNQGANPAYVSFSDDVSNVNTTGEMAWAALPNGNVAGSVREIRAGGRVYVYSPLGTTVDIVEEFGIPNREGGSVYP